MPKRLAGFAIYIIDNKDRDINDFYDVEDEKIGEGSFGRVCKCANRSTGAERAVKILRKVRRKSQLIMFRNELTTLKMLDHPHIVKLYEHFEDKKYMYMVMEYCRGGELFDRLLEVGHFTENQAAVIMQQVFRGIYYLHTMKVVHRDLKIENFMFAGEGPVESNLIKIIDFGFARSFEEGEAMKTKVGAPDARLELVLSLHTLNAANVPHCMAKGCEELECSQPLRRELTALSALSARGLSPSAKGLLAQRAGQRCAASDLVNVMSVAMRIPKWAELRAQRLCRRRFCPHAAFYATSKQKERQRELERVATVVDRNAGAAASERRVAAASETSGDWFVGCVPLSCLGHDQELRRLLWALFWHRLGRELSGREAQCTPFSRLAEADERDGQAMSLELRVVRLFSNVAPKQRSLKQLDPDVLEGLGQGPYDVVAVTDKPERAHALISSLTWPLRLRLLQPPKEQRPWRYKWFDSERYLLAYVTHLRKAGLGQRLVLYADAFDVAFLHCHRDLNKALERLGRPMFFGVEFDLYPAGLYGYPAAAAGSHENARLHMNQARKKPIANCREVYPLPLIWEPRPQDEHEPCLAMSEVGGLASSGNESPQPVAGEYLNGGFYGGRAADLELALRKLLDLQDRLPEANARGEPFRNHGKTHQYLWNQYLIEHPQQVALDYGGSFVVNLARRSIAARQFGMDEGGQMRSVLFQKPVCFIHANAGGYADMTFHLLRTAHLMQADSTGWAGYRFPDQLDEVSRKGLQADKLRQDRVVVDRSLCFGRFSLVPLWHGVLTFIYLVTPYNAATFDGLQFFIARPLKVEQPLFEIVALQLGLVQTRRETGRAKPPNGTHDFEGRNRFDTQVFRMQLQTGDCLGWRCRHRCDLTFAELTASGVPERLGVWSGHGRDLELGAKISLDTWQPRSYAVGAQAEIVGFNFYEAEILTRVRAGSFSFNDADWRHVSDLAKDLIRGLLRMSEVERVTAKQALFDQWIIQTAPVLRAPLKQKYFENMRKYTGFNQFKQASLQIIVSQLEPEILKPLVDTFMWLDTSGEGHIDADEIAAGMKRAGWSEVEMPDDLEEMVSGLDADGSGEIGLGEFVASVMDLQVYAREEVCWAVFRIFDQDGDGMIGNTDIYDILNNGQADGEAVSAHKCRDFIKEADEDGDKKISFAEFLGMMKGNSGKRKAKDPNVGSLVMETELEVIEDIANTDENTATQEPEEPYVQINEQDAPKAETEDQPAETEDQPAAEGAEDAIQDSQADDKRLSEARSEAVASQNSEEKRKRERRQGSRGSGGSKNAAADEAKG
ncbi:unnamed protein product [Effrenium voratum]|nr:unnamed protein product [Effrenium voratum]